MKRTKEEKRLAVLIHNAAFEQAKEDQLVDAPAENFVRTAEEIEADHLIHKTANMGHLAKALLSS